MNPATRKLSPASEWAILAIVLLVNVVLFGIVPIFQVLLIMTTNVTTDLPLGKVMASIALAVFCIASCYWVWKRESGAGYLLLAGITISSIITAAVKISVLRDEHVTTIRTWMLVQYFVPALFCLALNWVYFLRTSLHPS
ncbi:MAG TPA: hypothetical protein VJ784_00985 [Pyrinomonadaceae bacterium]|nr:hypothetical protein [Pyrinomonadaceae bacterium]